MSKSVAAAERAAYQGSLPEWDTQACAVLMEELLSSPASTPKRIDPVASSTNINHIDAIINTPIVQPAQPAPTWTLQIVDGLDKIDSGALGELELKNPALQFKLGDPEFVANELGDSALQNLPSSKKDESTIPTQTIFIKRNSAGRLRLFTATGEEKVLQNLENKIWPPSQGQMEDSSQKCSLSQTQQNSESAYEQYKIQADLAEDYPGTATPDDNPLPAQLNLDSLPSKYALAQIESTDITYQEDDPRHIKIDFGAEDDVEDMADMEESQDAPYAAPVIEHSSHPYEPRTPAAPVNPFLKKGSVMKGHELFGATQPSSVGRPIETPVSVRPSPSIYDDFSSPAKRPRLTSSPLIFGGGNADTSPLQSSVRMMLNETISIESPNVPGNRPISMPSLSRGLEASVQEPKQYISMKESQERRKSAAMTSQDSNTDSDDSDADIKARVKKRRVEMSMLRAKKELSAVEIRKKQASSQISSNPFPAVEVPSTRRSLQEEEEYIAQCDGSDARDTQEIGQIQGSQDEVIVDSQSLPQLPSQKSSGISANNKSRTNGLSEVAVEVMEKEKLDGDKPDSQSHVAQENIPSSQGVPNPNRVPFPGLDTVPETSPPNNQRSPASPPEERLRPMGEIASFSFGGEDDFLDDFPGLTQDDDFENARRAHGSSPAPRRLRAPRNSGLTGAALLVPAPLRDGPRPIQVASVTRIEPCAVEITEPKELAPVYEMHTEKLHETKVDTHAYMASTASSSLSDVPSDAMATPESMRFVNPPTQEVRNTVQQEKAGATREENPNSDGADLITPAVDAHKDIPDVEPRVEMRSEDLGDELALSISAVASPTGISADLSADLSTINVDVGERQAPKTSNNLRTKPVKASRTPAVTSCANSRAGKRGNKSTLNRVADTSGTNTTPGSSPLRAVMTPDTVEQGKSSTRRASKRTTGVVPTQQEATRSSKRHSVARDSSEDPLALTSTGTALFANMAFAISYVKHEKERERITHLIIENSGTVLHDGFDKLFEASKGENDADLRLSSSARKLGFTALIADEHSRKAKYMQALALSLPCISGRWISTCVSKGHIIDWSPYLLCAGMSSVLDATKSRMLSPYPAPDARLEDIISARDRLLDGKAVLFVAGKTKAEIEKRKAYTFLTRVLGPARLSQVEDLHHARKKLNEGLEWDMLYVHVDEQQAEKYVFGPGIAKSGKRKRGAEVDDAPSTPAPKRIRVMADETMVQSLIIGQLLD